MDFDYINVIDIGKKILDKDNIENSSFFFELNKKAKSENKKIAYVVFSVYKNLQSSLVDDLGVIEPIVKTLKVSFYHSTPGIEKRTYPTPIDDLYYSGFPKIKKWEEYIQVPLKLGQNVENPHEALREEYLEIIDLEEKWLVVPIKTYRLYLFLQSMNPRTQVICPLANDDLRKKIVASFFSEKVSHERVAEYILMAYNTGKPKRLIKSRTTKIMKEIREDTLL